MNKIYSLLGIGLLSAATLNSCKEDVFIDEGEKVQQGKLQTYTAIASIGGYEATEQGPSTRANVQEDGKSFMWNTDDAVTVWNGTAGYDFTAIEYNESEPSKNVVFTGDGSLQDGSTVWGIYPKKVAPTSADALTFTLNGEATQSGTHPELQSTMHMLAKGAVNGTTVTNLNFEHLTSLFHFSIKNLRNEAYQIKNVTVTSDTPIFPLSLTVAGEEKAYSDKVNTLTLTTTSLEVAKSQTANGYLSFFPTQDMTGDTQLTFTATIVPAGSDVEETIVKEGKVNELYGAESVVAKDGHKFMAGKRYGVSFSLVAELGYEQEGNSYLIKKEIGLINLANDPQVMGNADAVITLDADLDFEGKDDWTPVADFKGTLDGNGHKMSNLNIATSDVSAGLFVRNSGIIKNLTLEGVRLNSTTATAVGAFAANNVGTIQLCKVVDGTFASEASNAAVGAIAGNNQQAAAIIADCVVDGTTHFTVTGKANIGGIVGVLGSWNASTISGCAVGKDVSIVINDQSATTGVGGLVGWNRGHVIGSYSLATILLKKAANAGGLTGGSAGSVIASYSAGRIEVECTGFSAGGVVNSGGIVTGCYSTTVLPTGNSNIGGIVGKGGAVQGSECYFLMDGILNPGGGLPATTKLSTVEELQGKEGTMNNAITESGFEFIENNGIDKDRIPLLIQKIRK